MGDKSPKAVLK